MVECYIAKWDDFCQKNGEPENIMTHIELSRMQDIDRLMEIFDEARGTIAKLGIDQWQDGYPQKSIIEDDINGSHSCAIWRGNDIIGTFALFDYEPDYDVIEDGRWLTDENSYLAVHRVAIAVASRGSGASAALIDYAAERAKSIGKKSLRIDTHRGNVVMRRMLEKNGFSYCGIIHLSKNGDERVAYEKTL